MAGITSFSTMADVLASEGIINYDASAYVKGTKPRYIGKPSTYANSGTAYISENGVGIYSNPYQRQLTRMYSGGGGDAFLRSASSVKNKNKLFNIDKKQAGLAALVAGTGVYVLAKVDKKAKAVTNTVGAKLGAFWVGLKGNKNIGSAAQKVETAVKKFKIPTKFKVLGVVAATLFGAYKVATHNVQSQQAMGTNHSVPKY